MSQNNSSNGRVRDRLRLAIPSDGVMYEGTLDFLSASGMRVRRPSERGYTAEVRTLRGVDVVFQRNSDITARVEEGDADLGLVGFDNFCETRVDDGRCARRD